MSKTLTVKKLVSALRKIQLSEYRDRIILTLPFTDNMDDLIEVSIIADGENIIVDDLGRVSGLLFGLNQYREDSPALTMVKNLAAYYQIEMDYDQGVLRQTIPTSGNINEFVNFIKTITSIYVAVPEVKQYRKKSPKSHLIRRVKKDITKLQMPFPLETQVEVWGKTESWPITFRYPKRINGTKTDVLIVVADLTIKEPRQKAANVLALAYDLMSDDHNKDLRVVFEVNGTGKQPEVQRAKNLIEISQSDLKYRAFNYAETRQRESLLKLTKKDIADYKIQL